MAARLWCALESSASHDQKLEFVEKATKPGANISALCVEYGISRQSGHKWLRRYREQGYAGLVEHSRRPASSPLATAEEIVVSIVELRDKHPSYGPQKIARVLARRLGPREAPTESTAARTAGHPAAVLASRNRP